MSLDLDPNHIFRDFVIDGMPASGANDPRKVEIRQWTTAMWQAVIALLADANPGLALPNLLIRYTVTGGTANAIVATPNLAPPAGPGLALYSIILSQVNSGMVTINGKPLLSASGSQLPAGALKPGAWMFLDDGTNFRLLNEFGVQFLSASNTGGVNAITATTPTPLPSDRGALIVLPVTAGNTNSNVTVRFNGGPALPVRGVDGEALRAGDLVAGMVVTGFVAEGVFRLTSDTSSLHNKIAAEAAKDAAKDEADRGEAARTAAEAARDIAAGYASDAVSQGNVPIYATAIGMAAIEIPEGISAIRVNGRSAAGDAGGGLYKRVLAEPAHVGKLHTADGGWWELAPEGDSVDIRAFTTATSGNLYSALVAAKAVGATRIHIPFETFSVSPNLDLAGITLVGHGTFVSGSAPGVKLDGISRRAFKRFSALSNPAMSHGGDRSIKLLQVINDTDMWVVTPSRGGYARIRMQSGEYDTSSDSIGAPADNLRVTEVKRLDGCLVAWRTVGASSGATLDEGPPSTLLESLFLPTTTGGVGSSATPLKYHAINEGGSISYYLPRPARNRKGNIALYCSPGGSDEITVTVDGTIVALTDNKVSANNRIKIVEFWIPQDVSLAAVATVKAENTGTGIARVVCCNLYNLSDVPDPALAIDYWYVSSYGGHYREGIGASDYAIEEAPSGTWRGSFHGGESLLLGRIEVDQAQLVINHASGNPAPGMSLGRAIIFRQVSEIVGGYTASVITDFSMAGGYDLLCGFSGSMRVKTFYTAMATTSPEMNFVVYPYNVNITSVGDSYIGDTDKVVQYASGSGNIPARYSSIEYTMFDQSNNSGGGAWVRDTLAYKKVYAGPVRGDEVDVGDIRFASKHRFW